MTQIIPRTAAFEARYNTRMKFLYGSDVHIGDEFAGWETAQGEQHPITCRAIHFDGKRLYVLHGNEVTLFSGDMAEYQGMLMADRKERSYDILDLRRRVVSYMHENSLTETTKEVVRKAMWQLKWPKCLIEERARVFEATAGMEIG